MTVHLVRSRQYMASSYRLRKKIYKEYFHAAHKFTFIVTYEGRYFMLSYCSAWSFMLSLMLSVNIAESIIYN